MPPPITYNTLFYGDNLPVLREYIADASIDLIYLDPPFNSNRSYNVLFKDEHGQDAGAQIQAFEDTWQWNAAAERAYRELITAAPVRVAAVVGALREMLQPGTMLAYLVMMGVRLVELHRVLKPTGSLYLHCDPTASHYLKVVLDSIFGPVNFRNEIVWQRRSGSSSAVHQSNRFGTCTDTIFYYAKSTEAMFSPQFNFNDPSYKAYIERYFTHVDEKGRRFRDADLSNPAPRPNLMYEYKGVKPPKNGWAISKEKMEQWDSEGRLYFTRNGGIRRKSYVDELEGKPIQNLWLDIAPVNSQAQERLGYPTQKPLALLERIIQASSNPGDIVLDPFCGCGTAIAAAEKLGRRWIGIDVTHLAISIQKSRLKEMFPSVAYTVIGEPLDVAAARQLAIEDRYQFQWWALSLVEARPLGDGSDGKRGKKGADRGIDGMITFIDDATATPKQVIVQVKSGNVKSGDVRDLRGVIEREGAAIGVLITLEEPSREMRQEAAVASVYDSPGWGRAFPRLQIVTIAELLRGAQLQMPPAWGTFKQAPRANVIREEQRKLFG